MCLLISPNAGDEWERGPAMGGPVAPWCFLPQTQMADLGGLGLLNKVTCNPDASIDRCGFYKDTVEAWISAEILNFPKLQEFLVKHQLRVQNVPERNCVGVVQPQFLQYSCLMGYFYNPVIALLILFKSLV